MRFLVLFLLIPGTAWAGGTAAQFQNQIDLGAGIYVPAAPPKTVDVLRSKFDAKLPSGLDCSGLDLNAQLKAELSSSLSMKDLEAIGRNALAASASYLAAAFRPTWYETWQNTQKEASKKLQTNILECRQMEQQLKDADPMGLYAKNQQASKTVELANSGMSWSDAKAQAAEEEVDWKLKDTIAKSNRPIEQKANLLAVVGDISFSRKNGADGVGGDQTDARTLDAIYRAAREQIGEAVRRRFSGEDDCSKPLFSDDESTKKREEWLKQLEAGLDDGVAADRSEAWLVAIQYQISQKQSRWTGCGAVASWREDYLPEDRAAILDLITNAQTLRALGLSLRDARAELKLLKVANPDQAKLIDELSPLPQLIDSYEDLQREINERQRVVKALVLAHQKAEKQRREAADKRRSGRTQSRGATAPGGRF